MNPSRPYILRPVATSLLMVAIVILGAFGFLLLPVSTLPEVDYPTIVVSTFLPGASPDVMSATVTAPLERQVGQMSGLDQMSSKTSAGASQITLPFDLSLNLDVAEPELQAPLNAAQRLPPRIALIDQILKARSRAGIGFDIAIVIADGQVGIRHDVPASFHGIDRCRRPTILRWRIGATRWLRIDDGSMAG